MRMKIIIAGGRDFDDWEFMIRKLNTFDEWRGGNVEVISGGARGADRLGEKFGLSWRADITVMHAEWDLYGKAAGFIRNEKMAEYADVLAAFWDGKSRGTKHMIDIALREGLEVHVYRYTT